MIKKVDAILQKACDILEGLSEPKKSLLIWSFFSILVFGVIILTGTMTSGFHLVDDWEIAKYVDDMTTQSFWECLWETVHADLNVRLRPLYYINRVFTATVFGINLSAISIVKGIEIILAMGFLYYIARELHCHTVLSVLFALTVMVGYQSAVWWKLGPQESYGILIFSAGFLLLLRWLRTGKKYQAFFSLTAFFLMSIYKESFIMLLPFIMLYIVYDQMKEQKVTIPNLWSAVQKKFLYLGVLAFILAAELILLVFVVGTNNYSYVGLDSEITLSEYHTIWSNALHADLKWYARFGTLFVMIILTYWDQLKKYGWEILLTFSIIVPQVIIYSKPAIAERYILPFSFGISFFFVIVCCSRKLLSGKRRFVYILGLLLMLAAHGRAMLIEANYFTYRGNSIQTMLETTYQYSQENENLAVMSCLGPNTEGNLTMKYWMRLHGYDNMYYWKEDELTIYKEIDRYGGYYTPQDNVFEDMDIIIMYNREDRHWCYEPSLDLSDFMELKCGTLTMYIRKQ